MHVAVAGVAEDHHGEPALGRRVAHRADVLAHPGQRDAAVLDHLKRAARLGKPGEDRARRVAKRPQPLRGGGRDARVHACGPRRHGRGGGVDRPAGGARVVALHLDQQHRLGAGLADQLEESAVEELHRGRLVLEQRGHRGAQRVEAAEGDAEPRAGGG